MFDHPADGRDLGDVGDGFQFVTQEPVLDRAQFGQIMPSVFVDQRIFIDPADAGRIGSDRRGRAVGQFSLHLAQIFEHPAARPIQVGVVVEQHIDETVADKAIAAHDARARHRQHRRTDRIGHLILDDPRRLPRIGGADDDLNVRQIGNRIDWGRPHCGDTDEGQDQCRGNDQSACRDRGANDPLDHFASPSGRTAMPVRLASESSRNWPDATTLSPTASPCRISVWPPPSRPVCTSAG